MTTTVTTVVTTTAVVGYYWRRMKRQRKQKNDDDKIVYITPPPKASISLLKSLQIILGSNMPFDFLKLSRSMQCYTNTFRIPFLPLLECTNGCCSW